MTAGGSGGRGRVAPGGRAAPGKRAPPGGRAKPEGRTPPEGQAAPGKATATAPSNIAFVKYWGAEDLDRAIPLNPSISMTLERCVSRCTVEAAGEEGDDEVLLAGPDGALRSAPEPFAGPVRAQLERLRRRAGRPGALRVATRNTFPTDAGLASSASGFAALTLAALRALGVEPPAEEVAGLVRGGGSGSAVRSLLGGYVEWSVEDGEDRLRRLASPDHWDLRNVIAVVEEGPKPVSSREGHRRARTSPHLEARLGALPGRLARVREAIAARDPGLLGPVLEEEAVELHLVAMSSRPPIFYWTPGTLEVLVAVREMRDEGVEAFYTMDAGPNVHVLCPPEAEEAVAARLSRLAAVGYLIRDRVGGGPTFDDAHLF